MRCECCGDVAGTGGCLRCSSTRVFCCGVLIECGCGRKYDHKCRSITVTIACHPDTHCVICGVPLVPEHAHMRCPKCGQRDSCCF